MGSTCRFFTLGVLAYLAGWIPLFMVVSNIMSNEKVNTSEWVNISSLVKLKIEPNAAEYVAQPAYAPPGIVGFFVFTFLLFSSFGVWHLLSWAWPRLVQKYVESGYFGLSAVAKITLYLFLVLTTLAQSSVSTDGSVPSSDQEQNAGRTYAIGFGLTFGVVIPVVWITSAWILRRYKSLVTSGQPRVSTVPGSRLRWIDYGVSAPIMFVVLAVSWGCASAPVVAVGAVSQAIGIWCAAASDPLMEAGTLSQINPYQALRTHQFLAVLHLGSVVLFLLVAVNRNLLGLTVPLQTRWTTEPFPWYRIKANVTAPDDSSVLIVDSYGAAINVPVVLLAASFATWSGLCHVYGAGTAGGAMYTGLNHHHRTATTISGFTSVYLLGNSETKF